MSSPGFSHTVELGRDERELVAHEVSVLAVTWEEQEQRRRRILGRLQGFRERFSDLEPHGVRARDPRER
ncbi:MAG TPA: hypothetical protein VG295_03365 [Solirubrobacteraceae bacterium]|jgi:hypothetical protein|nr:hypothetical protein [Solirubrobacteraceae bacterium]